MIGCEAARTLPALTASAYSRSIAARARRVSYASMP